MRVVEGKVFFQWPAEPGRRYRVQFKESLGQPGWGDVTPYILATGPIAAFTAPVSGARERYYRVVLDE